MLTEMLTLTRSCFPDSRVSRGPIQFRNSDDPENEADLVDKGLVSMDEVAKVCE